MASLNQHSSETPGTVDEPADLFEAVDDSILDELESDLAAGDDDQFSGNELDEALGAEGDSILDELESDLAAGDDDQFSGNELDEALGAEGDSILDELESDLAAGDDDRFSGNELDEALDNEIETILEEVEPGIENQSDDQYADSETDDPLGQQPSTILEEIESTDGVTPITKPESKTRPKRGRLKGLAKIVNKKLTLFLAAGLLLLIGVGYFYDRNSTPETPVVDNVTTSAITTQLPEFDLFVIPLQAHDKFTYVSLSISFELGDNRLNSEFVQKKVLLRGIIYDILNRELNRVKEIPPVEDIKKFIIKEVNQSLTNGAVNKAYIMNFLAV